MLQHPALNWLTARPLLLALLGSLAAAGLVFMRGEALNDDAFTYVRVADLFLHEGLGAAFAHYPWASYSVLFAHFNALELDLFNAGLLVNAALYVLVAAAFVGVVSQLVQPWPAQERRFVLLLAAAIISLYPQLNEFRSMLLRDVGFWAFSLAGLGQLIAAARANTALRFWRYGIGFCVALGLAFAFRAEAIAYLLAAPWAFLFLRDAQGVRRLPDALRLSALCMALASLAAAACLVAGIDLVQLFTEFAATYRPFVETAFAPSDAQRQLLDAAAPIEHAANSGDGVFALFVSLPLLLTSSLASAISLPFCAVLAWGVIRKKHEASHLSLDRTALVLVGSFAAINMAILLGFVFITHFVSARYGMLLSLLLVAFVPIVLVRQRAAAPLIALLLAYCAVDSFYSFGRDKGYVDEAVAWVETHVAAEDGDAAFVSNSRRLAYASQRVIDFDQAPPIFAAETLATLPAQTLIAIDLNEQMRARMAELSAAGAVDTVVQFPNDGTPRIAIYRKR